MFEFSQSLFLLKLSNRRERAPRRLPRHRDHVCVMAHNSENWLTSVNPDNNETIIPSFVVGGDSLTCYKLWSENNQRLVNLARVRAHHGRNRPVGSKTLEALLNDTSSDIVKTQTPRTVSVQRTVIVRVCRQANVITEPACWRHNLIVTIAHSPPPQMSDVERGASRNVRTDTRQLSPNRLPTPDDWDATYTTEAGCVIHHCFAADHTARMLP